LKKRRQRKAKVNHRARKRDGHPNASQTAGSAGSYLGFVPAAIYSIIDNPDRYSAEKLEQKPSQLPQKA